MQNQLKFKFEGEIQGSIDDYIDESGFFPEEMYMPVVLDIINNFLKQTSKGERALKKFDHFFWDEYMIGKRKIGKEQIILSKCPLSFKGIFETIKKYGRVDEFDFYILNLVNKINWDGTMAIGHSNELNLDVA